MRKYEYEDDCVDKDFFLPGFPPEYKTGILSDGFGWVMVVILFAASLLIPMCCVCHGK